MLNIEGARNMNPEVKKFIDSVGATAEACAVFYKSCVAQNFTPEKAFELTKTFLTSLVMRAAGKDDEKQEGE